MWMMIVTIHHRQKKTVHNVADRDTIASELKRETRDELESKSTTKMTPRGSQADTSISWVVGRGKGTMKMTLLESQGKEEGTTKVI